MNRAAGAGPGRGTGSGARWPSGRGRCRGLTPPGTPQGTLGAGAAAALDLPRRLTVVAAAADKACEVLGCGVLEPDTAHLSFGTVASINTIQPRHMEVQRLLPAYPTALPGAIIEGLACGLRAGRERIEARRKRPLVRLAVSGGGAQSDTAVQIAADVFNLPAERPANADASALGAAMLCASGLGWFADPRAAVRAMARPGRRFEPDPAAARTYDALYREVYCPPVREAAAAVPAQPPHHRLSWVSMVRAAAAPA